MDTEEEESSQYTRDNERNLMLINGYWRVNATNLNIIHDIIIIILEYHRALYKMLAFERGWRYKAAKVHLVNNDKTAKCPEPGGSYSHYVLVAGDSVKQGTSVWRVKVRSYFFYIVVPIDDNNDNIQISTQDENNFWIAVGVSNKKDYRRDYDTHRQSTFYGISHNGWWLNGDDTSYRYYDTEYNLKGEHGEVVTMQVQKEIFQGKNIELDIYLDLENDGLLKFKKIGCDEEDDWIYETQMHGLTKCEGIYNGWIPHFALFGNNNNGQVQIAKIDVDCYGKTMNLNW